LNQLVKHDDRKNKLAEARYFLLIVNLLRLELHAGALAGDR